MLHYFLLFKKIGYVLTYVFLYGSHFTIDLCIYFGFHYYQLYLLKYFTVSLTRYFSSLVRYQCDITEILIRQ
jgi:hypothetical protein